MAIVSIQDPSSSQEYSVIESNEYRKLISETYDLCKSVKQDKTDDVDACKKVGKLVSDFQNTADLQAQQSMARSTRGILVASWLQFSIGIATFALIFLTLWTTWGMLKQASETTRLADETLGEAGKATDAALRSATAAEQGLKDARRFNAISKRPYLKITGVTDRSMGNIDFVREESGAISSPMSMKAKLTVENIGETPAIDVSHAFVHGGHWDFSPLSGSPAYKFGPHGNDIWDSNKAKDDYRVAREWLYPGETMEVDFHAVRSEPAQAGEIDDENAYLAEGSILLKDILTEEGFIRRVKFRLRSAETTSKMAVTVSDDEIMLEKADNEDKDT